MRGNQLANALKQTSENISITASVGRIEQASDFVTITDVRLKGNKMQIDVNYGGGCKNHHFQVIGSPLISKSLPPKRAIQLVHDANGDNCKMIIMKTLELDLKELAFKQEAGNIIYLTLGGWNQQIEYKFE